MGLAEEYLLGALRDYGQFEYCCKSQTSYDYGTVVPWPLQQPWSVDIWRNHIQWQ